MAVCQPKVQRFRLCYCATRPALRHGSPRARSRTSHHNCAAPGRINKFPTTPSTAWMLSLTSLRESPMIKAPNNSPIPGLDPTDRVSPSPTSWWRFQDDPFTLPTLKLLFDDGLSLRPGHFEGTRVEARGVYDHRLLLASLLALQLVKLSP